MPNRRVFGIGIVALVLVLAVGVVILRKSVRDTPGRGESGKDANIAGESRPPALHAISQRPAVTLRAPVAPPPEPLPAPAGAFEGRVVSAATGKGLVGAQLTFARAEETSSVAAGLDGAFRFGARVPGRWFLAAATATGYQPFAPEWGQSPVVLDARPGEVVRGITIALVPLEEYEGEVIDSEERPIAGAEIIVLGGGAGATALVPLQDRYRSDSRGSFRFSAPEDAIVEARREGFAVGRARVDYAVRVSRRLTIELVPVGTATPLLAIDGVVEDAKQGPAEGAIISATQKGRVGATPATARTDAQGRFRLRDLDAGMWQLVASRAGAAPAFAEVAAGTSGVRLQLGEGGRVAGRVRDRRAGAPVSVFTVLVQCSEMYSASVLDAAGRYELEGIAPGAAVVSVVAPGYAPSREVRVTVPGPGAPPAIADFDLTPGGRLVGVVVERGTRRPIPAAQVTVEGTPASLGIPIRNETTSDDQGNFVLAALGEGPTSISAMAPEHHARVISVPPIPDGESRGPITIELTPVAAGEEPRVELAGIGAMLEKRGEVLQVTMVAPGGGAAEVGLTPGDEVLFIDGVSVKPMTLRDAVPLVRGPEGTTVTLVVNKAGGGPGTSMTINVPRRLVRG